MGVDKLTDGAISRNSPFGGGIQNFQGHETVSPDEVGPMGSVPRAGTRGPRFASNPRRDVFGGDSGGGGSPSLGRDSSAKQADTTGAPGVYARGGTVKPHMAGGGTVEMGEAAGDQFVDPAAIPDGGITDNVPIMAHEGEVVISRAAAVAYTPETLRALNDPQIAMRLAPMIKDFLARRRGGMEAAGLPGDLRRPHLRGLFSGPERRSLLGIIVAAP